MADRPAIDRHKDLLHRWIAFANGGFQGDFGEYIAAGYVGHAGGAAMDRAALERAEHGFHRSFPDASYTIEDAVAEADRVVLRVTTRATHRETFEGIAPTGRAVEFTALVIYRVADGRIVESWGELDFLRLIRQLRAPASDQPRLYTDLAGWWQLLSAPADYEEEAAFAVRTLTAACARPPRTLLELGSGGGNNASHMKHAFERVVLVDRSPAMLAVSRTLNPDCEHTEGDMRTVRLGRQFDAVFVHDAVCYMTTEDDLRAAIETAFEHCAPGGAALLCPDHVVENFRASTDNGGHDGDGRALRYLSWSSDPDPADTTYTVDYAYLLREGDRPTRVELDRHVEGLFPRATWLRLLSDAGFQASVVPFEHSELEPGQAECFIARRGDATVP
jgi:predicted ester cyclase